MALGAHYQEPATTPCSCQSAFTYRSIFSLNLSPIRIQIPTGTSVTNCNHKHGLMLTCRHDVAMFTSGRIALSLLKRAHVDWNWPSSLVRRKNIQKYTGLWKCLCICILCNGLLVAYSEEICPVYSTEILSSTATTKIENSRNIDSVTTQIVQRETHRITRHRVPSYKQPNKISLQKA